MYWTEQLQPTNLLSQENSWQTESLVSNKRVHRLSLASLRQIEQIDLQCFLFASKRMKNWICALLEKKNAMMGSSHGFSNWKKTLVRSKEHQLSECHKLAMEFQISIHNSCGNIIKMSNDRAKKTMETKRFCLLKIIQCLQYVARQPQP